MSNIVSKIRKDMIKGNILSAEVIEARQKEKKEVAFVSARKIKELANQMVNAAYTALDKLTGPFIAKWIPQRMDFKLYGFNPEQGDMGILDIDGCIIGVIKPENKRLVLILRDLGGGNYDVVPISLLDTRKIFVSASKPNANRLHKQHEIIPQVVYYTDEDKLEQSFDDRVTVVLHILKNMAKASGLHVAIKQDYIRQRAASFILKIEDKVKGI